MPEPSALATPALLAVIVLATDDGAPMKSRTPKVLHGFAGRSMLGHVLAAAEPLAAQRTIVVVRAGDDAVVAHVGDIAPGAETVVASGPTDQGGTGHAVGAALAGVAPDAAGTVLVLRGDTPLLTSETLALLVARRGGADAATTIATDARSPGDQAIDEVAAGACGFDYQLLRAALADLPGAGAQLSDVVAALAAAGHPVGAVVAGADEAAGCTDRIRLAAAHRAYNTRLLEAHMCAGVTVVDPLTTWVDAAVTIEPDATLWPAVALHGATRIGSGTSVGPDVTLTDTTVGADVHITRAVAVEAVIGAGATVGPYAYLRPGTVLAAGVHIGTYVELKKADVGAGTKIPHLSYIGDATIGEHTNIGAATVFVNYDGVEKHRTVIGSHARTGADNMFVAPVEVGDGAYTAAGSVITEDVPPGALGVARAPQRNVAGWVSQKRPGTPAAEAAERAAAGHDDDRDRG